GRPLPGRGDGGGGRGRRRLRPRRRPRRRCSPRACPPRRPRRRRDRPREPLLVGGDRAPDGGRLPHPAPVRVSAVVVSHGHARELEGSLPALGPQVDELVVIANVPGSVPGGVEAVENATPVGFAANLNRGVALTHGDAVLAANPDAVPEPGAVEALAAFM